MMVRGGRLHVWLSHRPEGRGTAANGILGECLDAFAKLNIEVAVDICKLLKNRLGQPSQVANANCVRPAGAHADEKQIALPEVPR
jgi:hypothetical protein